LGDEDAIPMSGGQTLLPTMKARLAQPTKVIDLSGMAELSGITVAPASVTIKGATRHVMVEQSPQVRSVFPALADLAGGIGDPQVRNRGTIGGSVANNDPAACYPSACLGTGATIHTNARQIAADDFFQGMFDTALEEGELVTGVTFPIPERANYQKFVQPASRFALVGVFVAKFADGVRVAVTGASEGGVFRWSDAEAALSANYSPDAVPAAPPADGMIGDIHGTPEYRAHIVHVMTKRAVAAS
ncbi:MAG: FAD binding domain-containing protein, partial [Pseudomonadota bacterium]